MDDKFRDCITLMASVHFVTNTRANDRLINRLGIRGSTVYLVGSPAIDRIRQTQLFPEADLDIKRPLVIVNWQPETASPCPNNGLLAIIEALPQDATAMFISQNDDLAGSEAREIIIRRIGQTPASFAPTSYLSLLKHCDCLVGNSSSGLFEAPALGTGVVNVGNRQDGRPQWSCIDNVPADSDRIRKAIKNMIAIKSNGGFSGDTTGEIYGDGHACEKIARVIHEL